MSTAVRTSCPNRDRMSPDMRAVYDWLAANGIDEWVPEQPTFTVNGGRISYVGFKFDGGKRGFDMAKMAVGDSDVLTEERSVSLQTPPSDEVRAAFQRLEKSEPSNRARLVEETR